MQNCIKNTLADLMKMTVYELNEILINSYNDTIFKQVSDKDADALSDLLYKMKGYRIDIECDFYSERGLVNDDTDYNRVTCVLNSVCVGLVPYVYKGNFRKSDVTFRMGLADEATPNLVYINSKIEKKYLWRTALHELIHAVKFFAPDTYRNLLDALNNEDDYIAFRDSDANKEALEDAKFPDDEIEDETVANFYTLYDENNEIPAYFF